MGSACQAASSHCPQSGKGTAEEKDGDWRIAEEEEKEEGKDFRMAEELGGGLGRGGSG